MKNKFYKILLFAVLFFAFGNKINAVAEYTLEESSNDPVTCIYYSTTTHYFVKIIYDQNGNVSVQSKSSGEAEGSIPGEYKNLKSDVAFEKIPFADHCPKTIEVSVSPTDSTKNVINTSESLKVYCGNITGIPPKIPELTSMAITIIQIAVPVILVVMGSLDLFKGVTAQKEDEIKKGQQMFIKRLIVAALIFFVVVIVKLLISVVADASSGNIVECIDCFISNDCN